MPLISVVVPVYKVEPYLKECVDSILNQTFKDFELILVDDGSPDNCPAICDEYARQDNRVIVIHKENGGLSSARNAGLDYIFANSNSEYVSFVDSDDYVDKNYLSVLIDALRKTNATIAMCGLISDDHKKYKSLDKLKFGVVNSNTIFSGKNIGHFFPIVPAKLYKLDSFRSQRFLCNVIHEDDFFANRYYKNKLEIATIEEQLYYYRVNSSSIMHNLGAYSYICAIKAFLERLLLIKRNVFVHNKDDIRTYTNCIIGYFEKLYGCSDFAKHRNQYKKLLIKSFFTLPLCKQSISFRLRFLFRLF